MLSLLQALTSSIPLDFGGDPVGQNLVKPVFRFCPIPAFKPRPFSVTPGVRSRSGDGGFFKKAYFGFIVPNHYKFVQQERLFLITKFFFQFFLLVFIAFFSLTLWVFFRFPRFFGPQIRTGPYPCVSRPPGIQDMFTAVQPSLSVLPVQVGLGDAIQPQPSAPPSLLSGSSL
jgi:hypothetical protein